MGIRPKKKNIIWSDGPFHHYQLDHLSSFIIFIIHTHHLNIIKHQGIKSKHWTNIIACLQLHPTFASFPFLFLHLAIILSPKPAVCLSNQPKWASVMAQPYNHCHHGSSTPSSFTDHRHHCHHQQNHSLNISTKASIKKANIKSSMTTTKPDFHLFFFFFESCHHHKPNNDHYPHIQHLCVKDRKHVRPVWHSFRKSYQEI